MIYFIQSGGREYVKIGYCSGDAKLRLGQLQVGNPEALRLVAVKEGGKGDEARWHAMFEHLRVRGEWFQWTAELRDAAKPLIENQDEMRELRQRYARDLVAGKQADPDVYQRLFSSRSWSPERRAGQMAKANRPYSSQEVVVCQKT